MTVLDNNLYADCESAIKVGLSYLGTEFKKKEYRSKIDLLYEKEQQLLTINEVKKFTNRLENNSKLNRHIRKITQLSNSQQKKKFIEREFTMKCFGEYLVRNNFTFNPKKFSIVYNGLEKFINNKANYFFWTVIHGLLIQKEFKIGDMRIRPIKDQDFDLFFGMTEIEYSIHLTTFGQAPTCVIEINSKTYEFEKKVTQIQNFVKAYALFKSNPIQVRELTGFTPMFYAAEYSTSRSILSRRGRVETFSKLHKSQMPKFKRFFRLYSKIQKPKQLETAIDRFQTGIEAKNAEDIILDLTISLECLFSEKVGVTQAISNRMAILLGRTESETELLRKDMKKIYRIRSAMVHGDNIRRAYMETNLTEQDTIKKLVIITNNSILAFLELMNKGERFDNIRTKLDSLISYNSQRKPYQRKAKIIK